MAKNYMITKKSTDMAGIITALDEKSVQIDWNDEKSEVLTNEELASLLESDEYEVEEVELIDEDMEVNAAQASIHTPAKGKAPGQEDDGNPKTRLDWMLRVIDGLGQMDMESLESMYFAQQQAQIGGAPEHATDGKVDFNRASIAAKPSAAMGTGYLKTEKEEQDAIFGSMELTEESKEKVTTLFETAINTRVAKEVVKIQDKYDNLFDEKIKEVSESLIDKVDEYMNHVVSEWMEENKVATESTLRTELTNEFVDKLHDLFLEHFIEVPEEQIDVLETVVEENEKLEAELNKKINEEIEQKKIIKNLNKQIALNNLSEGLTMIQKTKLKELTAETEFDGEEGFAKKVAIIKEGFLKTPTKDSGILTEALPSDEKVVTENNVDPAIAAAARRMVKSSN